MPKSDADLSKLLLFGIKVDLLKINLKEFTDYRKYLIHNECVETLPCCHIVISKERSEQYEMSGDTILSLLESEGIKDPHYEIYRGGFYFPGGNGEW